MLVQCTKCRASGNVKVEDPSRKFKCPKCGGEMIAVTTTGSTVIFNNKQPAGQRPAAPAQQPPALQPRVGSSTAKVPTAPARPAGQPTSPGQATRPVTQPAPGHSTRPVTSPTQHAPGTQRVGTSTRVGTRPPTPATPGVAQQPRASQQMTAIGRRPRKKDSLGKMIAIGGAALGVIAVAVIAYFVVVPMIFGPGPGTKAMDMLPPNTIAAGSLENIQLLQAELQAGTPEGSPIREAIGSYNRNARTMLVNKLDVTEEQAASIVRSIDAFAFGVVPLDEKGVANVTMLVLSVSPAPLLSNMKDGGATSGVNIYEGKGTYAMALGKVLVMSPNREPLAKMATEVSKGSKQTLANVEPYILAKKQGTKDAIGWIYIPGTALKTVAASFSPNKESADEVFEFDSLIFSLRRQEKALVADGILKFKGEDSPLLASRAFRTADYVPEDVTMYAAVSIEKPTIVYKRIINALEAPSKGMTANIGLSKIIAQWEAAEPKLKIDQDLIAPIAGEIAFFSPSNGGFVLLVPGTSGDKVRSASALLARKLGADSEIITHKKVKMTKITKPFPVVFGFAENTLVLTNDPENVINVLEAVTQKKTLAATEEYQKGLGDESSIKILWRNKKDSAQGSNKFNLFDFKMDKSGAKIKAMMPDLADAVVAMAPKDISSQRPADVISPEPVDPANISPEPIEPSQPANGEQPKYTGTVAAAQENILKLHAMLKKYFEDNKCYPVSFAAFMRECITEENKAILVWPGDPSPVFNTYSTSYAAAFDVVPDFVFDGKTPGDTPMLWEIMGAHGSRRFVVYFDGTSKLMPMTVNQEALVKAAVEKMKEAPAEQPAQPPQGEQPQGEQQPPAEGEQEEEVPADQPARVVPPADMPPDGRVIEPEQPAQQPAPEPNRGGMGMRRPGTQQPPLAKQQPQQPAQPAQPAKPAIKMPKLPPEQAAQ